MKISIYGAGSEVTGSSFLVETDRAKVMVDCGQFQGGGRDESRNKLPRTLNPQKLDAVVISHGHLDHVGRLPLLAMRGYHGPVYATPATIDVAKLILKDAAKVQQQEVDRINRKRERAGAELLKPLFDDEDVDATMRLFRPVKYDTPMTIAKDVSLRMVDSGHILGSAISELSLIDAGKDKKLAVSGDLGPIGMPILKDPVKLTNVDWVFMESTYGDRDHRPLEATVQEFYDLVKRAVDAKGKILVPTFAIGRTQEMIYYLAQAFSKGILPVIPVYIDTPLGIAATEVYDRHPELYDEEMKQFVTSGKYKKAIESVHYCQTADESKALNDIKGPCLIMAGSGMCNAGRILHHLKHNLWKKETTVIFVGYQAPGSLGRLLIEGKQFVSVYGERIAVNATIRSLGGFSAHAGQSDLLNWYASLAPSHPRTTLIHGEDRGRKPLARLIEQKWHVTPELPTTGDTLVG